MEIPRLFHGKYHQNDGCFMEMLVYRSVNSIGYHWSFEKGPKVSTNLDENVEGIFATTMSGENARKIGTGFVLGKTQSQSPSNQVGRKSLGCFTNRCSFEMLALLVETKKGPASSEKARIPTSSMVWAQTSSGKKTWRHSNGRFEPIVLYGVLGPSINGLVKKKFEL